MVLNRGRGAKIKKIRLTSFMNGPLFNFIKVAQMSSVSFIKLS